MGAINCKKCKRPVWINTGRLNAIGVCDYCGEEYTICEVMCSTTEPVKERCEDCKMFHRGIKKIED